MDKLEELLKENTRLSEQLHQSICTARDQGSSSSNKNEAARVVSLTPAKFEKLKNKVNQERFNMPHWVNVAEIESLIVTVDAAWTNIERYKQLLKELREDVQGYKELLKEDRS